MSEHRELLAQLTLSQGNLRRFLEDHALPPIDENTQRAAGHAAAAATHNTQPTGGNGAAFFDIDNTLIQGSSLILLAQELAKRRFITLRELIPALRTQLRYRLFGTENNNDIAKGRQHALQIVEGKSVAELQALCTDIVERQMLDKTYQETLDAASRHLAAGQQVWLVSATPIQIGQALAQRLGFTGALGTVAEEKNGTFTGRLTGDILHGPGKKHAVFSLAALQGLDLNACTAYSDSINDLPMLSLVGHPVAINPDAALRRHAAAEGWPIRDYHTIRRYLTPATLGASTAALATGAAYMAWRGRR